MLQIANNQWFVVSRIPYSTNYLTKIGTVCCIVVNKSYFCAVKMKKQLSKKHFS